ncbi:chemotaxis protein CheA, partial [Arsukibacterium sp.]|uniref:chemotaxis protein CheA n=1 Tax=Arsukibacterium sp. TaxID=1977258 RepID=UPI002FD8C4E8
MSIDMSQFHGVFIEESHEHLDDIERLLMALNIDQPDLEELNSIFRAAHSIKGGSGIFGFEALISVTHVMENLFDKARQAKFSFTSHVIDELLKAVDILRALLNAYSDGAEPDWSVVEQTTTLVEALLHPAAVEEQGFGFFADENQIAENDDGFGFFKTPVMQDDIAGFGFFDETEAQSAAQVEEGFVFFEPKQSAKPASDKPDKASEPKIAASQVTAKSVATPVPKTPAAAKVEAVEANSIRVDISKVDNLVNLAGELVITQSMLNLLGAEVDGPVAERLQTALAELERNTRDLQESIMTIRMLPLSFVFNRFPRVVRDLSHKLHKQVELVIEGGQTEIDKGLIERLVDPLTHLVRNSLDHGIEVPATRLERGKPELGKLTLKAEQKGGNILISVIDDGG